MKFIERFTTMSLTIMAIFITTMNTINIAPFLIGLSLIKVEVVHLDHNSKYILNALSV